MNTWNAKAEEVERNWVLVDAAGQTVGRLATQVVNILRGKNKPTYTPHVDTGDFVVVINSDQVKFTGNKAEQKKYYTHSGYVGSTKEMTAAELLAKDSTQVVRKAVEGMLPKNRLSNKIATKLKIYTGAEHPHTAQKPVAYTLKG